MINVCQVVSDTNVGGAGRYLLNYVKYFDRESFNVSVILPRESALLSHLLEYDDIKIIEADNMADKSYDKNAVSEITKIFKETKPDIVHTHASLSARIAARRAGVKKIIATRHCIEPKSKFPVSVIKSTLNNLLCDVYIAVSKAVTDNLKDAGIPNKKIVEIDNGVNEIESLSADEKIKIKEKFCVKDSFVFGIFARLEEVKGHKYFIDAAKKFLDEKNDATFLIVGDGTLSDSLKEQSKGYPKIKFLGYVKNTTELLNITDVNVITSESEAMSLAILEAMSLAKPTIATNVGGNPQVVLNNTNGILTAYKNADELKNAFLKFYSDKEFYEKCSFNAKKSYNEKYTAKIMVNNLEKLYKEVL